MICAARQAEPWALGEVMLDARELHAALTLGPQAFGLIVMAYTHGAARREAVQQAIAKSLCRAGMATCIVELLDPEEAEDDSNRKDIELLADRLHATLDLLFTRSDTRTLPLGILAADKAVPAALSVADSRSGKIETVIACYGRPDRAPIELASFTVPTLLVVPSKERSLVEPNQRVFEALHCPSQFAVIVGASRAFNEPGTLVACDYVVQQWCERFLRSARRSEKTRS
jgi:putative phosphoribosyl transferase